MIKKPSNFKFEANSRSPLFLLSSDISIDLHERENPQGR